MYILTSIGLSYEPVKLLLAARGDIKDFRVAIVTTAADGKEKNKYAQLAYQQFRDMGVKEVCFFDIEKEDCVSLKDMQCIYVCGGNTYYLSAAVKNTRFAEHVKEMTANGGVYIGVSAGSVILGTDISIVSILGDENDAGLVDMSGMGIINEIVCPHYSEELEQGVKEYEEITHSHVIRLTNDSAIVMTDDLEYMVI